MGSTLIDTDGRFNNVRALQRHTRFSALSNVRSSHAAHAPDPDRFLHSFFGAVYSYSLELGQWLRRGLSNKSWRVDETYVQVKGRWCYLYRAIDSASATIDFLSSALRNADAARQPSCKKLSSPPHP